MFKNSKSGKDSGGGRSNGAAGPGGVNTVDTDTHIEGNIKAGGNIRIDGSLVGNLDCGGTLVIGPKGSITGDVSCTKAIIEGSFEGNIVIKEDLTLETNAQVTGDVKAQRMAVMGGATVSGTCTVPYTGSSNGAAVTPDKKKALATA